MITLAACTQFKRLNLSLLVAQGCYFTGFELPCFGNFTAPFLPIEWWSQYAPQLEWDLGSGFFGKAGKKLSLFSILNTGGVQSILVDIPQAVTPTDSQFLTHTIPPQNIPCLGYEACPYAALARTVV